MVKVEPLCGVPEFIWLNPIKVSQIEKRGGSDYYVVVMDNGASCQVSNEDAKEVMEAVGRVNGPHV